MAASLLSSYMLLLPAFALQLVTAAQASHPNITLGSSLTPTTNPSSWLSPSGRFAFGFYPEGCGFSIGVWLIATPTKNTVIWTESQGTEPVSKDAVLKLTEEGLKLLLTTSQGEDRSISNVAASSASMLDSGNFVIYDSSFGIIWCIQPDPAFRPCMKNVVTMLEGNMEISIPPRPIYLS